MSNLILDFNINIIKKCMNSEYVYLIVCKNEKRINKNINEFLDEIFNISSDYFESLDCINNMIIFPNKSKLIFVKENNKLNYLTKKILRKYPKIQKDDDFIIYK